MASWEEARKCPRCNQPGKQLIERPDGAGGKVIILECQNEDDKAWGPSPAEGFPGERYVVQVRADGTIPDPQTSSEGKVFSGAKGFGTEEDFEALRDALRRSNEQMTKPEGGETR